MPQQMLVAKMLAEKLSTIAHPLRIRIIEALGARNSDVNSLAEKLKIRQSTLSQHLSLLRANGIVEAQREGRTVRYSLSNPWLATWLLDGCKLLEMQNAHMNEVVEAARAVKKLWRIR